MPAAALLCVVVLPTADWTLPRFELTRPELPEVCCEPLVETCVDELDCDWVPPSAPVASDTCCRLLEPLPALLALFLGSLRAAWELLSRAASRVKTATAPPRANAPADKLRVVLSKSLFDRANTSTLSWA